MKAAFIFDTILLKEHENYYGMTLTYNFLKKRYLSIFNELIVSTRVKEKEYVSENIQGYKITNGNKIKVVPINSYKNIPDSIIKRKKINKELESVIQKVDKVIIRMPSVLGIIACNICKKLRKDYIVEMVACAWDGYFNHTNPIGKLIAPIMYLSTRKAVYKAPKVLYVTEKFLQKRYPTSGESISCSDVDLETMASNNNILENRVKKISNINFSNPLKLCTVANVQIKYKGQEYVIKALSKLNKSKIRYKYILIGNGNGERLKKIAKKYNVDKEVIVLGSLSHEEVFEKLDEIDLYIQPSLQEGLPRALLEAMSRACPCIGSNAGGIPELLGNETIFNKKNVNQIEEKLESLYGNIDLLTKLAKDNFEESNKYTASILDEKRKKIYKN